MIAFHEKPEYPDLFPVSIFSFEHMNFLPHWHNDVEIIHVYDGNLRICVNAETRILTKGDSCICRSGDIHSFDNEDLKCHAMLLLFHADMIDHEIQWPNNLVFQTPFLTNATIGKYHMNPFCSIEVGKILSSIHKEMAETNVHYTLFVKSKLYELAGLLLRNVPTISIQDDYYKSFTVIKKMQNALDFIHNHYKEPITLQEISHLTGLKTSQFSNVFKHMCGMSFVCYLNQVRMKHAEDLILNTSDSITDISFYCGFCSIRNFNYTFKKQKGIAPSDLRRKPFPSNV